ncbi:cell division protein ZipA C-terminal FtsZ-binding domain-containing protein [Herbaspirillum rhizosphaerae]|uniref:cell division protein ZipA C-terminal FtsZ-binding domain-containing protein n=1 Tax=Herbaspirillum rhizosphaerae TaxID=346179 RepID=UPI00067CAAAD|nr:cell division protein ZipA C-terminal FtsZ-binding domain-containing protein [Herbaspirillum rhizosphaerae]
MTDLQTSLIVIGGVIVVGVISYNKWQEHKTRKTVERAFSSDHDDVLMNADAQSQPLPPAQKPYQAPVSAAPAAAPMPAAAPLQTAPMAKSPASMYEDDRLEPELYERPKPVPNPHNPPLNQPAEPQFSASDDESIEPYLSLDTPVDSHSDYPADPLGADELEADLSHVEASLSDSTMYAGEPAAEAAAAQPQRELPVDELVDCIIPIALDLSVRGEKILPGVQNLRHVGNKTVNFVGRTVDGEWEAITHGSVYNALLAGVQLANRNNALNELEYSELIMRLREFTDSIGAEPEVPDMIDVMKTAQALHQFIMDHDVQLGVNVRSNGAPWNVSTLLAALTRQGFDRRTDGHLVMQDGEGEVLFSMSTNATGAAETTDRLTLLLDVPRVGPARDGYGAMIACARSLAMRLGGTVVDDSDQLLSDAALSDIAEQVSAFYSAMESAEIPAGSKRAMRLFS